MDNKKMAELLFPHIDKTPQYYEELYPERKLKEAHGLQDLAQALRDLYTWGIFSVQLLMKDLPTEAAVFSF